MHIETTTELQIIYPAFVMHKHWEMTLEARDGARHTLRYNPHTSECEGLPLPVDPDTFEPAPRVAKDRPLGKSRAPRVLKIQLGLSCNYACSCASRSASGHLQVRVCIYTCGCLYVGFSALTTGA